VTGTQAVIKSPHLDRLTPLVSRRGLTLILHQRTVHKKVKKKKTIIKIKTNHNQYWYIKICKNQISECIKEAEAIKGSG
jgi:hypothetical protein